jgi:gluconolactonase
VGEETLEILDARFERCVRPGAPIERLADGCQWAEGPAYLDGGVVWSDIPNDRMLRWDEATGAVTVFRAPSAFANGNTLDPQGRLVTCEHGPRRVTRTERDGSITVIADRYDGKRLNSPNDVVVRSDGSVWFTDPSYGIDSDEEGYKADSEIGACHVYRVDPDSAEVRIAVNDFVMPNGLAFSIDERRLYVSDTGATKIDGGPAHIRAFDVGDDGSLSGGDVFATSTAGLFDGFRFDTDGRLWTSAGDGVHCLDPDGKLIGKVRLGEETANVVFGGPARNRLFITASTSLYAVALAVRGA